MISITHPLPLIHSPNYYSVMDNLRKALFYCCLGHPNNFEEDVSIPVSTESVVNTNPESQMHSVITHQITMKGNKKTDKTGEMKTVMRTEL